jgi:hypothetical protein
MDQYSGYGVYGRHNREYTLPEVKQLLTGNGFTVETSFTADVHDDWTLNSRHLRRLKPLLTGRAKSLGQYLQPQLHHGGVEAEAAPQA